MAKYNHLEVEPKWQAYWEETKANKAEIDHAKEKLYVLDMFPYPSGAGLHVGHPEGYTATDIYCRTKRMQGYNVMHPMGWDAFGLPAENYAIKTGTHPSMTTQENIDTFRRQIQALGFSYDWDREVDTTDADYFKWTQWIFLQIWDSWFDPEFQKARPIRELPIPEGMSEEETRKYIDDHRLTYESEMPINWCDSCKTGIANEEVKDGKCDRCGEVVVRKNIRQWVMRITKYADRLISELDGLDWSDSIKDMQRNWIGRSEGAEVGFEIATSKRKVLLLHGFGGTPDDNFFLKLKAKLETQGHEVFVPQLPNTDTPDFEETMSFLRENYSDMGENDIILGHSMGGHFAMHFAIEKNINNIYGIAPALAGDYIHLAGDWTAEELASIDGAVTQHPVDYAKLAGKNVHLVYSDDEPYIPVKYYEELPTDIFQIQKLSGKGHFNAEHYPEIDALFENNFTVYTTRPDTLFGATYCVLSPEHKLLQTLNYTNKSAVADYQAKSAEKSDLQRTELNKEKTGVRLEGVMAINPINNAEIPIYISDYVLATYGTGAIMAVPAHDTRDHEFARKFGIEIIEVVESPNKTEGECYAGKGRSINSGELSGLPTDEMKSKIIELLEQKSAGKKAVNYKLRDWNFSRQRYWGEPIPIIHCEKCGKVAERNLPLLLPDVEAYEPTGTGESPLAGMTMWVETTCPVCGGRGHRETNTMPQWAGSCWYYLRYLDNKNPDALASEDALKYWLGDTGVDLYVGGAEHAVLHLLYSRFWHKVLNDLGHVPNVEPFRALKNQGMILGADNEKMSKSRGNVVNPDDVVEQYGADSLRLYEMFMGPFEAVKPWQMSGVEGVYRFLGKVWRLQEKIETIEMSPELKKLTHQTIKKVTEDINNFGFNTAISQMMILTNEILKQEKYPREAVEILLQLLAPFAPHITEELWEIFGHADSIFLTEFPKHDESLCIENETEIAVQVLGKLRGTFTALVDIEKDDALSQAKKIENVQKFLEGKQIIKEIYIPGKIINLVVK